MMNGKSYSALGLTAEFLAIVGLLFQILVVLASWNFLPEKIPVHFGFDGQSDAWGGKIDLLMLFILSAAVYVGLTLLARYPQKFNYPWKLTPENAERQYQLARNLIKIIKGEVVWIFGAISLTIIGVSLGKVSGLSFLFVPLVMLLLGATIIVYLTAASRSAFGSGR